MFEFDNVSMELLRNKIPNQDLLQMAQGNSSQLVSVLIYLDLPLLRVQLPQKPDNLATKRNSTRIEPYTIAEHEMAENRISKTRVYLENLLQTSPLWLESSRVFVVSITPTQLRAIAYSDYVKAILLNRLLP